MLTVAARLGLLVAGVILAIPHQASGQDDLSRLLMDLQRQEDEAERRKDLRALDGFFLDDAILIRTDGSVETKAQFLEQVSSFPDDMNGSVAYSDVAVRRHGDTAIVNYVAVFDRQYRFRLTVVWVAQGSTWRVAATHGTALP